MENQKYSDVKITYNSFSIIILIVIIILLCVVSYWSYNYYINRFEKDIEIEVLKDIKDAGSKFTIGSGSIPNSKYSNEYSISMWINIYDYNHNYGKDKIILRRGDNNPIIYLDSKKNDLIVKIKLQGNTKSNFNNILNTTPNTPNLLDNKLNLLNNIDNDMFNKISGNNIDYPYLNKDNSNECEFNYLYKNDMQTLLNNTFKEKFNCNDHKFNVIENKEHLLPVNIDKLQNNLILTNKKDVNDDYFRMVSGNQVISCPRKRIENFNEYNPITNKFTILPQKTPTNKDRFINSNNNYDMDELINITSSILISLCKITKKLQLQSTADKHFTTIDKSFSKLLTFINNNSNIDENIELLIKDLGTNDTDISDLINDLMSNLMSLQSESINKELNKDELIILQTGVNTKLENSNCELMLNGVTDMEISKQLFQNIVQLIKTSLYTYIVNLGNQIKLDNPDLSNDMQMSNNNQSDGMGMCVYNMIPLQKWVHVIISVYNQVVDIYIDGQLGSSCVLKGFPDLSTDNVELTPDGGFSGQISKVSFYNTAMTVSKAYSLYTSGPYQNNNLLYNIPSWLWYSTTFIFISILIYSFYNSS